jgi:hypothetical protein
MSDKDVTGRMCHFGDYKVISSAGNGEKKMKSSEKPV